MRRIRPMENTNLCANRRATTPCAPETVAPTGETGRSHKSPRAALLLCVTSLGIVASPRPAHDQCKQ